MVKMYLKLYSVKEKAKQVLKEKCREFIENEKGSAIDVIISIAVVVIIAAFITIPAMRTFASSVTSALTTWWNSVKNNIFATS